MNMVRSLISRHSRGLYLRRERDIQEPNADEEKGDRLIKSTFKLLEEGEKEIKFDEKHKNIILILGNTGSGKSTFTQWLAGDNTKLISKETSEGTQKYIIIDRNRISDNTLKSKTIFPELVIENKTNTAFYDCPGFSDTQGTSHEIAETYFIKKVIDFSKKVKMIFLLNHSSVNKGVDRQDFMKLVRHVTDLVKDFDKFKNSIALVATKVDAYNRKGLIEDKIVITAIANFLQEAKQYLVEESLSRSNLSEKEKKFYKNAIKFVEILLEKENDQYTRIGLFRRPDEPGPLSEIELLKNGKKSIEKILYGKLQFTSKNNNDFGYTVSERTKNDISDIVAEINKNLESSLKNIARKIQEYYRNLIENVRSKIRLLTSKTYGSVDINLSDANAFRQKLDTGYSVTIDLLYKLKNLTNPEQIAQIVNKTITNLNIVISKHEIVYIENQGKYFTFLQTVSDKKLSSKPWDQLFNDVKIYLFDSKKSISQDVKSAAENINSRLKANLNDIAKIIKEKYSEIAKSLEIPKLPEKLRQDSRFMSELIQEIEKGITTEKLENLLLNVSKNLGISLPKDKLRNVGNQGKYLRFLEVISNENLIGETTSWVPPFRNVSKYFSESEKWYTFLEHLYSKLSEYVIQKDRQKYDVDDLDDWGQPGKAQGISISPYNFQKFLKKIESFNLSEYNAIKNLITTGLQIEELNQVLNLTLKHRATIRCSKPHIIVKGSFVVLGEIMHKLQKNLDTNNSCEDFEDQFYAGNYKLFKIFALNRMFIDTDLSFSGKQASIAIIAPRWEIMGSRVIDISGSEGRSHWPFKAENGAHPGNNGADGAPGRPGGSAKSFFGVGDTFVNGAKLKISANGGRGGAGQDGGDGCPGKPGNDAPKPSEDDPDCDWNNMKFQGHVCAVVNWVAHDKFHVTVQYNYRIYGERGGKGGDGGDGGRGGKGGYEGNIVIQELRRPSKIVKNTSVGEEGDSGTGGDGRPGGKDGNNQLAKFTKKNFIHTTTSWELKKVEIRTSRGPDGSDGIHGGNNRYMEYPTSGNGISNQRNIINDYKSYLRENINNRFQKTSILSFLNLLNSKYDAIRLYEVPYLSYSSNYLKTQDEILALFEEFRDLEEEFLKIGDQIDFLPFYTSLLKTINVYANDKKAIGNEGKKVLSYMYTATLGKIYNLRENSQQILITNVREYLDMIEENMKSLKDVQVINNKVDAINKYKETIKNGIVTKIKETQSLIERHINPEIENMIAEIDDQINSLIQETVGLKKNSDSSDELEKKKKVLENTVKIKGIFYCVKIYGRLAGFVINYGEIFGIVINGETSVSEHLALKNMEESINIPTGLETSLYNLKDNIESFRKRKVDHLQKLLENVDQEIMKNPETMDDLKSKIEDIRVELQKALDSELDFKSLRVLETEFEESIKIKESELKKIEGDDKKITGTSKALEKVVQVLKFGSLFSDMYDKYKEDKEELDIITSSMEEITDIIEMLKGCEDGNYNIITSMFQNGIGEINDTSAELKTISDVAFDVTKWQVQSALKDMKLQTQKLPELHEIKYDLDQSIEKLDDIFTTLINIYDRMQSYVDLQNLANYITDISSVEANNIDIEDQLLANAENHLENVIRADLVIKHCKSAIDAFRQWVFPFADNFINNSMLPVQLLMGTNIESVVETATGQIEAIRQKLQLYDTSIMEDNQFFLCEEFSSRYPSSQPFYEWKNEENRRSIHSLLSGKEVVLKADIKESAHDEESIKFSEIKFDFKAKNNTVQTLLSEILRGFDIKATHLGNSYYKYESEIILITSDSVTISYSYEMNENGIPIRSNEAYNKLKSGDLLLSPYTLWEVRLIDQTNKSSFQDLYKYKNEITIELSGLGSYVLKNATGVFENNSLTVENESMASPERAGLRECQRSKHRSTRSVNGITLDGDFTTNDASKSISSPIVFLYNFFKTYFVRNVIISFNQAFFGEKTSGRSIYSEPSAETINIGPTVTDTNGKFARNDGNKENIEQKLDAVSDMNFHNNSCLKSFLLSHEKYDGKNYSIHTPDLNCSLLLADLVTRTITSNKYKPPIDECLLSPREVMLGKIRNVMVCDENDVKQMLQRHLSVKEVRKPSSLFRKLNDYAKSVLQILGFEGKSDNEAYVQDIRHLFA